MMEKYIPKISDQVSYSLCSPCDLPISNRQTKMNTITERILKLLFR